MQSTLQIFKKGVLRYPRLDTVLMVEETIRKAKGDLTVRQIWQKLPKKVMWQTYLTTLDYLEYSGKILLEEDKHVSWVWAPAEIQKLKNSGLVVK
ncbi:MAG: hypothetical protein V1494_00165 [Candidatus Diapherotrites archaeon]